MNSLKRFANDYIRPYWFRMLMVMVMAGITSSYSFLLGFISKVTVDDVLQLKPASQVASGGQSQSLVKSDRVARRDPGGEGISGSSSQPTLNSDRVARRDPYSVIRGLGHQQPRMKTRTEKIAWLWGVFILYLIVRSTFATINWFYSYNVAFVGQRIVFRIRLDLHQKVQRLHMTFFDRQQTGKIMSRILDDVGLLQSGVTSTFVDTIRQVAAILIGMGILLTIDFHLGLLALLAMPLYVFTYKMFLRPIAATFARYRETYADTYGILEERVKGIRVVLSFAREKREFRQFFRRLGAIFKLGLRSAMLNAGLGASCSLVSGVASGLIFYLGALQVRSGVMSVGDLIYFNMSLGSLFQPIVALTNINASLQQMLVVVSRVFEVIDEEIMIRDKPNALTLKRVQGRVAFQNVSFKYNEAGDYVLKDLNFEVKLGTSVAVVGPSGSGKSTLVSLLIRLYDPTEGTVLLDDYNLRDIKISSLRNHISMVPQEPVLFSGTIVDNIRYGREGTTPEQVMNAAKSAELHDFIMTLPEKYEARVEERGSNLSGGQKQRLAFSMALVTDPSILILDDTTSALDAKTEAKIQQTLDRIMEGRTTFVITHRISTAMRADRVLVLDNGRMVGWGEHEKLLETCEVYRRLYDQQRRQHADDWEEPESVEALQEA